MCSILWIFERGDGWGGEGTGGLDRVGDGGLGWGMVRRGWGMMRREAAIGNRVKDGEPDTGDCRGNSTQCPLLEGLSHGLSARVR